MTNQDKPALILIDIQKGFEEEDVKYWGGRRNNPDAEKNARKLLDVWRQNKLPIFHIQHCSIHPKSKFVEGKIGNEFQEIIKPNVGEQIIKKNVHSAFIGTDLKERLDKSKIKNIIIAGLTTDHCVSTSARMAGDYGYETFVVSDATATFDKVGVDGQKYSADIIHDTALASLHKEFVTVIKTEELKTMERFKLLF